MAVDEPVGSSSRVPGAMVDSGKFLQKEITLKIGCHNINGLKTNQQKFETLGQWLNEEAFDIIAVTETNMDRKEGFFVGKKVENFKFFWSDISIDKKKGLGVAIGIKHNWEKYLGGIDRISEFMIVARFYFRNMELVIIAIYIPPNNGSEMDKVLNEITSIFNKRNIRTHIVILGDFNCIVDLELDKISESRAGNHRVSKIHRWLSKNDFIDAFRFLHPTEREVTWSNSQSGTRIDQIWVSENLMESLTTAEILDMQFVTCSDHKATSMSLWLNSQIFGTTVAIEKN